MTDPLAKFRAEMDAMTPGAYRAINAHDMDSDPHPEKAHVWAYTPEVLLPGRSSLWPDGMSGTEVANCEESADPEANAAGIVRSVTIARRLAAEGAEEVIARVIDPVAFETLESKGFELAAAGARDHWRSRCEQALTKARSIIAAIVSENTVKVTRPSVFGNPFVVNDRRAPGSKLNGEYICVSSVEDAVECYREMLAYDAPPGTRGHALRGALPKLRGKNLACFCPLDSPCHADVLLALANTPEGESR